MIRGHELEHFLDESMPVPPKVVTGADGQLAYNLTYRLFRKQDSSLASWLLSTIGPSVLPQLVGVETTAAIWKTIINKQHSKQDISESYSFHIVSIHLR
ncbi:hypothetical protein GQ457_17G027150 [Hibiscus cannabinus]